MNKISLIKYESQVWERLCVNSWKSLYEDMTQVGKLTWRIGSFFANCTERAL